MKVLLTGGSGFLGSHIAERLARDGHTVRALVRRTSGVSHLRGLGAELADGALDDAASLRAAASGVDAVVHCAALIKARSEAEFMEVNEGGTRRVLDAALAAGSFSPLRRFVLVSSLAATGPSPDGKPRCEDEPPRPLTAYGRSKLAAEKMVLEAAARLPVTVIRPPAVYGPRDREILALFKMVRRGRIPVPGDPEARASIVYGPDCADAVCAALTRDHPSGRVYHVDDGPPRSWLEMGRAVAEALKVKARPLHIPFWVFGVVAAGSTLWRAVSGKAVMLDSDKLTEIRQRFWVGGHERITAELRWTPATSFADGAAATARWYLDAGWL
jgi:nucleoside-diphosphate-sugar epimerase